MTHDTQNKTEDKVEVQLTKNSRIRQQKRRGRYFFSSSTNKKTR
jgi:hypothetical protein